MKRSIFLAGVVSLATGIMPAFAADSEFDVQGQVQSNEAMEQVVDNDEMAADELLAFAPGGGGGGAAACGKKMSFTDEQLEKINTLKNQMADATGPKKLELHSLKRQLRDQLTQTSVDKGKVTSLQSKINSLKGQISDISLGFRLDTLAVLTDEQKQEMRHRYLQRSAMPGGGRHKRFGHGHGHFRKHVGGAGQFAPGGPSKAS